MMFSPQPVLMALESYAGTITANATEMTRSTIRGGQITRKVGGDGLVYARKTTRIGRNGGTYSSTATCLNGIAGRCHRRYSATAADGKSFSGHRASTRTVPGADSRKLHGPSGNTEIGVHRRWR